MKTIHFEEMPQWMAQLDEKVDALTETVRQLYQELAKAPCRSCCTGTDGDDSAGCANPPTIRITGTHPSTGRSGTLLQTGTQSAVPPIRTAPVVDGQPTQRPAFHRRTDGSPIQRHAKP